MSWIAITTGAPWYASSAGQEINTGEAGIDEWLRALASDFPDWNVHVSDRLETEVADVPNLTRTACLHLATSIRSFRAERLSDFVGEIIDGDSSSASKKSSANWKVFRSSSRGTCKKLALGSGSDVGARSAPDYLPRQMASG